MPQTMKLTAAVVWKAEKEHWGPDTPNKPTPQHRAHITSGYGAVYRKWKAVQK